MTSQEEAAAAAILMRLSQSELRKAASLAVPHLSIDAKLKFMEEHVVRDNNGSVTDKG